MMTLINRLGLWLSCLAFAAVAEAAAVRYYELPRGARPHDVAPDPKPGGAVWYTAQGQGARAARPNQRPGRTDRAG